MSSGSGGRTGNAGGGDGIERRDFINGILIGGGGALASRFFSPLEALACVETGKDVCDGLIGTDPRALRGGNLPSAFNVGHWLRDERLTFSSDSVKVAPSPCDSFRGNFRILEDTGTYDVIIAGSGMSGLAAAFFLQRRRPGTKVLILDANHIFGGNAQRDDAAPIPRISSTAGAYAVTPYDDFLFEIYGETGIDWASYYIPDVYSYYFDSHTPYADGTGWVHDVYGRGVRDMQYPARIIQDLQQAKQDLRNWYNTNGSPTDPADGTDPKYDYLAQMTLDDYLTRVRGFHPAVSDFYTRFAVDALAGRSVDVNALTSISFLGAEYNPLFTFPGGTSVIARHVLKYLIPTALAGTTTPELITNPIQTDQLDLPESPVRLRQRALVVRADNEGSSSAQVIYYRGGNFYRATAKAVILAGQGHTAHRVVVHLIGEEGPVHDAWCANAGGINLVPVVTANVTLRKAAPIVNLGLGYNNYWWGSHFWADFVVADWMDLHGPNPGRFNPDRETVLTFYGANFFPPEEMYNERVKLLTTPFSTYEESLRQDLDRILNPPGFGSNFDFDSDVSAVYIYRWGHGMVYPAVGYPFGPPQQGPGRQVTRRLAARHLARIPIGRIHFAAQDTDGSPAIESAIGAGLRATLEVLPKL